MNIGQPISVGESMREALTDITFYLLDSLRTNDLCFASRFSQGVAMGKIARSLLGCALLFVVANVTHGQSSPPPSSPPSSAPAAPASPASTPSGGAPPAGPSSSGTFSIEAEIFGHKSLQSDSEAIACDVAGFLYPDDAIIAQPYGKNALLTPTDWTDEEDRRYEPRRTVRENVQGCS
jgi:hypothetical protein